MIRKILKADQKTELNFSFGRMYKYTDNAQSSDSLDIAQQIQHTLFTLVCL